MAESNPPKRPTPLPGRVGGPRGTAGQGARLGPGAGSSGKMNVPVSGKRPGGPVRSAPRPVAPPPAAPRPEPANESDRRMREALDHLSAGRFGHAEAAARGLLSLHPEHPEVLRLMGTAQAFDGRTAEAEATLKLSIEKGGGAPAHVSLGHVRRMAGRAGAAHECFVTAHAMAPTDAEAVQALAVSLEEMGECEEARARIAEVVKAGPANATAQVMLARCERECGLLNESRARLLWVLSRNQPLNLFTTAARELGLTLEQLGDHAGAVRAFGQSKAASAKQSEQQRIPADGMLKDLAAVARVLEDADPSRWAGEPGAADGSHLAFVVGLPRAVHPAVDRALSEWGPGLASTGDRSLLARVSRTMVHAEPGQAARMAFELTPQRAREAREAYMTLATRFVGEVGPGRVMIDAQPMNVVHAPVALRLFPSARFIIAVRDPRETAASCIRGAFAVNRMTGPLHAPAGIGAMIGACAEVCVRLHGLLGERAMVISYENAHADPAGQTSRIAAFLGVQGGAPAIAPRAAAGDGASWAVYQGALAGLNSALDGATARLAGLSGSAK